MYDLALYGHLTFDRIYDGNRKNSTVGSIGNVWKFINKENPNLKISIEPTDFGEALIMVDRQKGERASVANLSQTNRHPLIKASRWSHILYLNELSDASFIFEINQGIVSADLCKGKMLIICSFQTRIFSRAQLR